MKLNNVKLLISALCLFSASARLHAREEIVELEIFEVTDYYIPEYEVHVNIDTDRIEMEIPMEAQTGWAAETGVATGVGGQDGDTVGKVGSGCYKITNLGYGDHPAGTGGTYQIEVPTGTGYWAQTVNLMIYVLQSDGNKGSRNVQFVEGIQVNNGQLPSGATALVDRNWLPVGAVLSDGSTIIGGIVEIASVFIPNNQLPTYYNATTTDPNTGSHKYADTATGLKFDVGGFLVFPAQDSDTFYTPNVEVAERGFTVNRDLTVSNQHMTIIRNNPDCAQ